MSAEAEFARLFPHQPLPSWALTQVQLLDDRQFDVQSTGQVETVALERIVGTNHPSYGGKVRWVDMLRTKKKSNFSPKNWPGFLGAKTSDVVLVRVDGTQDYYLFFGGNHRIAARKLAGQTEVEALVCLARPRPGREAQPIRLVSDGL